MSVLYVAEVGSAHKGNVSLACEMIRQAAQAGASIVKFQFGWSPEVEFQLGLPENRIRYMDDDFVKRIASFSERCGIELMASIWSEDGLRQARMADMKRYKIAHQMAENEELISLCLSDGKPVFISNPATTYTKWVEPILCPSSYPAYCVDMPDKFTTFYGYSDHSHGIGACLLAVARGAQYIEKHVALDKSDLSVRDTSFSATFDEFTLLVRMGKEIEMFR
jgi:N,N'-diacetyllegionaminate synthase